ncbi:methionine synthase [Ornithinimicrobium sp. Arc0846-15]|nr:methionine synthase [Ornithinimicrobium laminariae]
MVAVSGIGSWPGVDSRNTIRMVRDLFLDAAKEGLEALPYLPELPDRGPGADMIGRTANILVDLPVDVQPQGWRMVDHPGRDAERALSYRRQDLDELAEAYDGYSGALKLQVVGPWTLAANVWLPLGDRVLSDLGATRDLGDSLAEGVSGHIARVQRLIPGVSITLQIDEPSLASVVRGRVRTESGYSVIPAPDAAAAAHVLAGVVKQAQGAGAVSTVIHSCASGSPIGVMRDSGAAALALDTSMLGLAGWDSVAEAFEAGTDFYAGLFQPSQTPVHYAQSHDALVRRWQEIGLSLASLQRVTVTPACGLAGVTPAQAREATARTIEVATALLETSHS